MLKKILYLLFAVLIPVAGIFAQVTTSSLTGNVTAAGKGLVGATVKATHQPSGTVYTTASRADGNFTINNMRVGGPYKIEISFVGYKTQTIDEIYLKLGEPYVLNTPLDETSTTITGVQVTAANRNSVLNANRTGSVTHVNTRQINTMPSVTRSLNDLTRLTPQASSTSQGAIAGGNYRQNYITVDGSDFNNTFGIGGNLPANGSPISLDALSEISINIAPYDVRQSGFIGSSINAVTRSGTNQFSGSAYMFWRNEKMQGNKVAHNAALARQNLEDKTIGFRFGGPIIKNKLFFFMNAEQGKRVSPGQLNVAATSSAPFGSSPNIARPTETFLNDVRTYLKNTYQYETGPYQGYDNESDNTRIVGRLDWNINNNHRMNLRYSQVESKGPSFASTSRSPLSGYATGQGRQTINHLWFKNSNYYQEANFYSLAGEVNSTFGKVSNTFRGTWTNQNDPRSSDSEVFPFVDILDGNPIASGSVGNVLTSFGYEPFTFGNLRDVSTLSFVDYLNWTTGKHNWTLGAQADFQSTKNGFQRFGTSYYTFRSWNDFITGQKPVDFAITYPLTPGYEQAFPRIRFNQYSVYGQDEMILSDRFRLTVGLRADYLTWPNIPEIKTHPLVANLTFAEGEKINTGTLPEKRIMWSPRVGFNWDVRGDRSLQVRGGTGIFTGRVPTVWIVAQSGDAGLLQFTQVIQSSDRNNPANFTTPGPFNKDPRAYLPATPPAAGTAIPSTISAIDENFRFPQTWKTSFATDFRLGKGFIASIEGVYNKDINVALGRNPNLVAAQALNVSGYADNRPIYPVSVRDRFLNPITSAGQPVATGATNGTAFNPVILDNGKKGHYWSLTGRVEKQFSKNWSAFVAYTRSQAKNIYDGTGDQLLNTWSLTQIVRNANSPELSYANYIVPDRIVASITYRKEYLKHLATSVSLFFEGSIQGRFSYTYTGDLNRDGQTNDLIYVPKDPSEITFVDQTYGSGSSAVTYTAKQQSDIFFKYIEQDKYLSSRRGQYAERNGAKMPWRNQVDVKLMQDIFSNIGGKRNTLQFTVDIFNFGNLLNKEWGIFQQVNAAGILTPRNVTGSVTSASTATTYAAYTAGGATRPVFSLAQGQGNLPVTTTYRQNNSITSTYYMQFGLRYIFN